MLRQYNAALTFSREEQKNIVTQEGRGGRKSPVSDNCNSRFPELNDVITLPLTRRTSLSATGAAEAAMAAGSLETKHCLF
jgi:hypothetical protein